LAFAVPSAPCLLQRHAKSARRAMPSGRAEGTRAVSRALAMFEPYAK